MSRPFLPGLFLTLCAAPAAGQPPFLPAEGAEWRPLREHCRDLLKGLDALKAPLPPETARALAALLEKEPRDAEAASAAVQKLLDPHCLLGVSINAESRVKVERGPAAATLVEGRPAVVLVKVHNEGGVTHALAVSGPQLRTADTRAEGRWLEAAVVNDAPFGRRLSGRRLEYRVLRLTAHEGGKREATLQFDVGQGTQDLGFRGEVPVLFTVRTRGAVPP
jgi:hypothetical protein